MKAKVLENKKLKEERLMRSALELFSAYDIKDITIQDIVNKAGVAKGTFYLYFKDKYQIQNALIRKETRKLFKEAFEKMKEQNIEGLEDRLIFIIDQILVSLEANPFILRFIKRNLSWGIIESQMNDVVEVTDFDLPRMFKEDALKGNYHFDNPDITLFIIIEMIGSTCYSSIMNNQPKPMGELKPYLFDCIRAILRQGKIED